MTDLLKCYRDMLLIRRFEEKSGQLYIQGMICGFCHLYIGQEAVAVGINAVRQLGDRIVTSYRDHGVVLAIGTEPGLIMAELMGKASGVSKGKGGSMHIFDPALGFYGGHGIVGAQVPIGAGLAFADKYNGGNKVTFAFLGDGAINQGQVYETFNMAALWKLPVIFVIENNQYGMGTSVSRASANPNLWQRGESLGVPGKRVDGMDLFEVMHEAKLAADSCRNGEGPYLLEMETYRYRGHSVSDPAKYRSKEDVDRVKQDKDSIEHLAKYLIDKKLASEGVLEDVLKEVKATVDKAIGFASQALEPELCELYTDVIERDFCG